MNQVTYTTVDRILSKVNRDLRGTDINETDLIEWIGEALDFLTVAPIQEERILFVEVKDHEVLLPQGFAAVLQVAMDTQYNPIVEESENTCPANIANVICCDEPETPEPSCNNPVVLDCEGKPITDYELAYYRPYFDLQYEYHGWTRSSYYDQRFKPVRLSNNVFFNSLVCKEKDSYNIYNGCEDEYSIVGTTEKKLRFSFREGFVAVSYLANVVDIETGYPMIPDNISYITAVTFYVKWMMASRLAWSGRQGFSREADKAEIKWLKYARQAKNNAKMPKGIDQHQNLLEESHKLIPRLRRYHSFFGSLGREEYRQFNDPDHRRKLTNYYGINGR